MTTYFEIGTGHHIAQRTAWAARRSYLLLALLLSLSMAYVVHMFVLKQQTGGGVFSVLVLTVILVFFVLREVRRLKRELKKSRQDLAELNLQVERRVQTQTNALQALNKELESFAYVVSHDLSMPLRVMKGYSDHLLEKHASSLGIDGIQAVRLINRYAGRMEQLIGDLLAFSRAPRAELRLGEVDMKALASSVVEELREATSFRNGKVSIGDMPPARGDYSMMRQVWYNLVSNAFKYTRPKPDKSIRLRGWRGNGELLYSVEDNGVGFDESRKEKLFGVFQRLHSEEEFEGNGVGLAIVHQIVVRHGGKVWAFGEEGKGAKFFFSLPNNNSHVCNAALNVETAQQ